MSYDNGEVLQGLDENWNFMGANIVEWASGVVVFLLVSLLFSSPSTAMPFMLAGWVLTTVSLAALRHSFPDQERGVRNALCSALGVAPPGLPAPASIQPRWSAVPLRELDGDCKFKRLGLGELFPSFLDDLEEAVKLEELRA